MTRAGFAIGYIAILFVLACQKKDTTSTDASINTSPNSITLTNSFSYSDSIFYRALGGTAKIIFPVSKPITPGYFAANMPGLDLDSASGRINLSRSESGLRYRVYYLSLAKQPIDSTQITVSGIDYKDAIYNLSTGSTEDLLAIPVYNMTPEAPLPCATDTGRGCKFDETDLNSDGIADIPGANQNKLIVDVTNGVINLRQSYLAGIFGPSPINGRRRDITIYYRLDDGSGRTLNKITLRLVYYQSMAYIPESMLLEIDSRNERYQQVGTTTTETISLLYYTSTYTKPKRPPLIVIVSGL